MTMREPLDEKVRFYLDNKEKIDEWLALPKLEQEEADRFLRSLEEPLNDACDGLPGSPTLFCETLGRCSFCLLHREEWLRQGADSPLVGIGLEWQRSRHGFYEAFFGLRVNLSVDGLDAICDEIKSRLADVPDLTSFRRGKWYPVFRKVRTSREAFWNDSEGLDALADDIIENILKVWNVSWEVADAVLAKHRGDSSSQ